MLNLCRLVLIAVAALPIACAPAVEGGSDSTESELSANGCSKDLSKGAIVMLSGGGFDSMNPPEVRARMDAYIDAVNASEPVSRCSGGRGLAFKLLPDQKESHLHQGQWKSICAALVASNASPIVIAGHSNGGAAAVSLARCLEGKGKDVDLLITADSVPTLDDLGDVYTVPANVKMNINTFVVPNALTFLIPFPIGKANKRPTGSTTPIINIGMDYLLPGAIAHRNAFYDFAGGDVEADAPGGFARPFALLDLTVAHLGGADTAQLERLALQGAGVLSASAKIKIEFAGPNTQTSFARP